VAALPNVTSRCLALSQIIQAASQRIQKPVVELVNARALSELEDATLIDSCLGEVSIAPAGTLGGALLDPS